MTMNAGILVLDFGSQVTQLIARRLREVGVYAEILPFHTDSAHIKSLNPKGIILSGSPMSVLDKNAPSAPDGIYKMGVPVLGICYGQQLMCAQLGGKVEAGDAREFGRAELNITASSPLFAGLWGQGEAHQVWMSHGDKVAKLPSGFTPIATSQGAPFAAIADETQQFYGVQFHPEVIHTPDGKKLLEIFAKSICGTKGDWSMASYRDQAIKAIRDQVGEGGKVICGLSGGVDSSVTAVLIHEAIGARLTCVFVDHGLMRKGEAEEVVELFSKHYNIPLVHEDASELFLSKLENVEDPETKRKIIGGAFIEIFEKAATKIKGAKFLAQGTLYPDVIESVSIMGDNSVTIKSHHNVGGLPEAMQLELVEPLRALFKDEVRALGRELAMPETLIGRHPFPGPGLAIRIPGAITKMKLDLLREADAVYLDAIRKAGLYNKIWQAFAVLLPVRAVGVMGDARSYDYALALRAVTSTDGMTAETYPFTPQQLTQIATRIVNEVKGINRVTYDITSKPPGTIEWE